MKRIDVDERNPSQSGILSGQCKGKCWINTSRTLAITYSYCVGGCGIFGEIIDNVHDLYFFRKVFDELRETGVNEFEFSAEDERLRNDVLQLFASEDIKSEMELSYRMADAYQMQNIQITGYEIVKVDSLFLDEIEHNRYRNYEGLVEKINESWKSLEDFITKSKAFVAIKDSEIVGTIFGSGRINNILAIDIEVERKHRNKGIARWLSHELMKECAQCEMELQWDCIESNRASIATAESLGFKLFKKRPYFWFTI